MKWYISSFITCYTFRWYQFYAVSLFKAMDLACEGPFQWQIQDFPEEQGSWGWGRGEGVGAPTFQEGAKTYPVAGFFAKTAWKWKTLEKGWGRIPSTSPFGPWLTKWSWGDTCMWSVGLYLSIVLTQEGLVHSTLMTPISAHKYFVEVYGTHTHTCMQLFVFCRFWF